jgi:hypothetical protein
MSLPHVDASRGPLRAARCGSDAPPWPVPSYSVLLFVHIVLEPRESAGHPGLPGAICLAWIAARRLALLAMQRDGQRFAVRYAGRARRRRVDAASFAATPMCRRTTACPSWSGGSLGGARRSRFWWTKASATVMRPGAPPSLGVPEGPARSRDPLIVCWEVGKGGDRLGRIDI